MPVETDSHQAQPGIPDSPTRNRERAGIGSYRGLRQAKVLVVLAAAMLCSAYCWRMGFSEDSLHYVDIARLIADRGQAATLHLTLNSASVPDTNLLWPPVYPILLAGPLKLGLSAPAAAALVAIVAFAGTLAAMVCVLRRVEWVVLSGIVWLYLITVCGVGYMALSEGPFVLFVTLSLVCLGCASAGRSRSAVLVAALAGVLAGLAALTRWTGVFLVASSPAALLATRLNRGRARLPWAQTLLLSLAYILGTILTVGPWLVRNQLINGVPLGPPRPDSLMTLTSLMASAGKSVYLDFGAILLLLVAVWAAAPSAAAEDQPGQSACSGAGEGVLVYGALAWAVVYTAGVFGTLLRYDVQGPDRHLFTSYAALAFAAFVFVDRTRALTQQQRRRLLVIALVALPLLLVPVGRAFEGGGPKEKKAALAEWVRANTAPDSLLIGTRIWELRTLTGRPVLESGYPSMPPVTDGTKVAGFLSRFGTHFDRAFLILDGTEQRDAEQSYEAAGLELSAVESRRLTRDAPSDGEDALSVYEVRWPRKP